jgi:hypothetical protein
LSNGVNIFFMIFGLVPLYIVAVRGREYRRGNWGTEWKRGRNWGKDDFYSR